MKYNYLNVTVTQAFVMNPFSTEISVGGDTDATFSMSRSFSALLSPFIGSIALLPRKRPLQITSAGVKFVSLASPIWENTVKTINTLIANLFILRLLLRFINAGVVPGMRENKIKVSIKFWFHFFVCGSANELVIKIQKLNQKEKDRSGCDDTVDAVENPSMARHDAARVFNANLTLDQ